MPLNANDTDKYLNANVFPRCQPEWAEEVLEKSCGVSDVVVTQGFVAKNPKGENCLLGRGGSDTSGSLLSAMVQAHHLEIWTDVYG
jgi:diaminopimelate decarboxylase/aspartate kinase